MAVGIVLPWAELIVKTERRPQHRFAERVGADEVPLAFHVPQRDVLAVPADAL